MSLTTYTPRLKTYVKTNLIFADRPMPLHAMVVSCGYQVEKTLDYFWDGLRRGNSPMVIWQYTLAGEGLLVFEKNEYRLTPGMLMMVMVPHEHCYYLPRYSPKWEFFYLCLNGRDLLRICGELIKEHGPSIPLFGDFQAISTAEMIINRASQNEIRDPWTASSLAYELIMKTAIDCDRVERASSQASELIRVITEYCVNRLDTPLTVDELAAVAGFSRFHFSRLFKERSGMSPAAFVKELRLKKAKNLLQMERISIGEIADRCGFQSLSYFCRAFQKRYHVSPGMFRNDGSL